MAKNYRLFRKNPPLTWFFRAILFLSVAYAVATSYLKFPPVLGGAFDGGILILLGFSLVIVLFSLEPQSFRNFWDKLNMKVPVTSEISSTVINGGCWIFSEGENLYIDVVVFGHTHFADDSKEVYKDKLHKQFINSGTWDKEKPKIKVAVEVIGECEINTFVYIDDQGPLLFYWPMKDAGMPVPGGRHARAYRRDADR